MADEAVKLPDAEQVKVGEPATAGAEEKVATKTTINDSGPSGEGVDEITTEDNENGAERKDTEDAHDTEMIDSEKIKESEDSKDAKDSEVKVIKKISDSKDSTDAEDAEMKDSDESIKPTGDNKPTHQTYRNLNTRTIYRKNVKSSYNDLEESSDPVEIRKQVEFYFSDANLPSDKFLFEKVCGTKNLAVPIKEIHMFKRMRHFQPYSAVVAALRESTTLDVIDGPTGLAGTEEVQRKVPLGDEYGIEFNPANLKIIEGKYMAMSVYVKGFGEEKTGTQMELEAFFAPYNSKAVWLRRANPTREFKGSVFVTFDSVESQQAFLKHALENDLKYKGQDLEIMSKQEYCDMKAKLIAEGKIRPNSNGPYQRDSNRGRGRSRGGWGTRGGRGRSRGENRSDRDRDDWKGRRDDFQKNGFRGRDDRRNRGRRDRSSSEHREDREQAKPKAVQEYDDKGVPIVKSTKEKDNSPVDGSTNYGTKKREREDDETQAGSHKKSKINIMDTWADKSAERALREAAPRPKLVFKLAVRTKPPTSDGS